MCGVESVVGLLQQVGDHKRRVGDRHRDYSQRQPPRGRDTRDQRPERHTAERRQHHRRALPRKATTVDPRKHEQGAHQQRQGGFSSPGGPHKPAERKRRQQGHTHERDICERLRTPLFSDSANRYKPDHRDSRYQRPQRTAHPCQPPRRPGSRQPHHHTLAERE